MFTMLIIDNPKLFEFELSPHVDKDCVAMLKRMYGGENGFTKKTSWSMEMEICDTHYI
jgi:hypothetical protein